MWIHVTGMNFSNVMLLSERSLSHKRDPLYDSIFIKFLKLIFDGQNSISWLPLGRGKWSLTSRGKRELSGLMVVLYLDRASAFSGVRIC